MTVNSQASTLELYGKWGYYNTNIYTQNKEYLINTNIKQLINQLDPNYFWTIHRGTIVNLEFVSKISKNKQDKDNEKNYKK